MVHERCAGLDVHKHTVVAGVLITQPEGTVEREVRTFATMTGDRLALSDWLDSLRVGVVARESTGGYWKPVCNWLADGRTIILVNPQHIKAVPGRKTDGKDSEWLADLLRHGLLTPSFIPPHPIRELRELTRYRQRLGEERARAVSRVREGCWRAPTSSSPRWPRMGWARVAVPCWKPSLLASRIQSSWRLARAGTLASQAPSAAAGAGRAARGAAPHGPQASARPH